MLEQFKLKNYSSEDFERAISAVMDKLDISRLTATSELLLYMTEHGDIEDFKNCINYVIEKQKAGEL